MFQFASTLGIANKLGLSAVFPIENCFNLQGSGPFDPILGRNMLVKCDLTDCFEIDQKYFIPRRHTEIAQTYIESDFKYNPETENITDGTCLYGYFQTEKYFSHIRNIILDQFTFKKNIKEIGDRYMGEFREKYMNHKIISLHVRRGDYVMFPDHHPICSKEYYNSAISKFEDGTDKVFLVFSDDIEWCRPEFFDQKFVVCDIMDPYVELYLMSLCDHHIIANSSFSWWGAWLNIKEDKIVIAPSRWFGPAINKNTEDVYSQSWIKF